MTASFDVFGNPSSVHAEGRASRAIVDAARRSVAAFTGCSIENVIFTAGGTEALGIALSRGLDERRFDYLLIGAGEHPAVHLGHRFGTEAEIVPLKADGVLDLDALAAALRRLDGARIMLAIQAANNETGVIQPVRAAADMVRAAGGYVVCDAVQAAGKIGCYISEFGADALAISAHKFGGPKGVGALCFAATNHHLTNAGGRGGGQERGLRPGTENLAGIAGMGAACTRLGPEHLGDQVKKWRDSIERIVRSYAPEAIVFGAGSRRLPNTVCFAVPGFDARVLLMSLDLEGVAVSAGSACAAGKVEPSRVLLAMGVDPGLSSNALRVSLGWTTTEQDIEVFANAFAKTIRTMRPRVAA